MSSVARSPHVFLPPEVQSSKKNVECHEEDSLHIRFHRRENRKDHVDDAQTELVVTLFQFASNDRSPVNRLVDLGIA